MPPVARACTTRAALACWWPRPARRRVAAATPPPRIPRCRASAATSAEARRHVCVRQGVSPRVVQPSPARTCPRASACPVSAPAHACRTPPRRQSPRDCAGARSHCDR